MCAAAGEETQQRRSLLNTSEGINGLTRDQREHKINAQTERGQARPQQPEAPAQTFALAPLLDSACGPEGSQQKLENQEAERSHDHNPVGEKGGGNQSAQTAQRIENNTLYHAAPITRFIKHIAVSSTDEP